MKVDLKTRLKSKGISQRDISLATGWSQSEVYKFVNGLKLMPQNVANVIAEKLGMNPEEVKPEVKIQEVMQKPKKDHQSHDARVNEIEYTEGLIGVESNAQGLFYLLDKNTPWVSRRKLSILSVIEGNETRITLTVKQAKEFIKEFEDVCEMQWEGYINV